MKKKESIVQYLDNLNSGNYSKEYLEFSSAFKDFTEFAGKYLTAGENGKYSAIDKKEQKVLNGLLQKTMKASKTFLDEKSKSEVDDVRKDIVKKLNDNFLEKVNKHLKSPEFKRNPTFEALGKKQREKLIQNNKPNEKNDVEKQLLKSVLTYLLTSSKKSKGKTNQKGILSWLLGKNNTKNTTSELENQISPNDLKVIEYICEMLGKDGVLQNEIEKQNTNDEPQGNLPKEPDVLPISVMAGGWTVNEDTAKHAIMVDDLLISSLFMCLGLSKKVIKTTIKNVGSIQKAIKDTAKKLDVSGSDGGGKQTSQDIERISVNLDDDNVSKENERNVEIQSRENILEQRKTPENRKNDLEK